MARKTRKWVAALTAVTLMFAAGNSEAAIVASDAFEVPANGSTLAAGPAVVGSWSNIALSEAGSAVQISTSASSALASGNQGLRLLDKPGESASSLGVGGNPGAKLNFVSPVVVGATATDYVNVAFDALMTDPSKFSNMVFRVHGSGGSAETAGAIVLDRLAAGNVYYLSFTTAANQTVSPGAVGTGLSTSTWYRFNLSFDTVNRKYSASVFNGTSTTTLFSGVNFGNSVSVDDISAISIGDNSNNSDGGEILFDNIVATTSAIPEPASVGLFGSLIAMVRRRR